MRLEATSRHRAETLVLLPYPLFPTDQGNRVRTRALCQRLKSRGLNLHALLHLPPGTSFDADAHVAHLALFETLHIAPETRPIEPPSGRTHTVDEIWDPLIGSAIKRIARDIPITAMVVNYAPYSPAFEHAPPGCTRILDLHDRLSGRREFMEEIGQPPSFFYLSDAEERACLDRADLALAIKEEEAEVFRSLSRTPVLTLGVDVPGVSPCPARTTKQPLHCAFVGSGNAVNVHTARALVRSFSMRNIPTGTLHLNIYGDVCQAMGSHAGAGLPGTISLRGRVETVNRVYEDNDIVLSPTLRSTGVKIKTVEALASGRAVVATRDGISGLPATHPAHTCLDMDDVLDHCLALAADPDARKTLEAEGTRLLSRYQSIVDASAKEMFERLHRSHLTLRLDPTDTDRFAMALGVLPRLAEAFPVSIIRRGRGWTPEHRTLCERLAPGLHWDDAETARGITVSATPDLDAETQMILHDEGRVPRLAVARSVESMSVVRRAHPQARVITMLPRNTCALTTQHDACRVLLLRDGMGAAPDPWIDDYIRALGDRGAQPSVCIVSRHAPRSAPATTRWIDEAYAIKALPDRPTLILDAGQPGPQSWALRGLLYSTGHCFVAVSTEQKALFARAVNSGKFRPLSFTGTDEAASLSIAHAFNPRLPDTAHRVARAQTAPVDRLIRTITALAVARPRSLAQHKSAAA